LINSPAKVSAPFIQIHNFSQLQTTGPVTIFGSVVNSGIFQVNGGSNFGAVQDLFIIGMQI
jgi:hypothetical protein